MGEAKELAGAIVRMTIDPETVLDKKWKKQKSQSS